MTKNIITNKEFRTTSAKQACARMTDKNIEDLLNEKINNLHFYAHYDLAQHKAGLNNVFYNGYIAHCDENAVILHKTMKQELDARVPDFELLVHAVKTVKYEQYPVKNGTFAEAPVYAPNSRYVVGNIIFRDTESGQIRTLDRWIGVHEFPGAEFAAERGATTFADCAAGAMLFRHALLQEIQRKRGLIRNF